MINKAIDELAAANDAIRDLAETNHNLGVQLEDAKRIITAQEQRIGELETQSDNDLERVVHYRNLALELGAKPEQMLNNFDRGLAEKWGKGNGYDAKDELRSLALIWDENEQQEQRIAELEAELAAIKIDAND